MRLQFAPMQEYLWNPSQWQGSRKVQKMNWAERGLYRELMDECYLHGSIPGDSEGISDMLGDDTEVIAALWPRISRCFELDPEDPGRVISPFIEDVRTRQDAKRRVRADSGKAGADKRWQGDGTSHTDDSKCHPADSKCHEMSGEQMATDGKCHENVGEQMATDSEEGGRELKEKESTPLSPQGGMSDAATLFPMPPDQKPQRKRKGRYESEDIAPENAEYLKKVYERVPQEHPCTREPIYKGPYATAARAFQAVISAGEASARELMAVGTLYYRAESLGTEWVEKVNRVWDSRERAMMHVSTLYGPEKRPYRQLLPIARELIQRKEAAPLGIAS